MTATSITIRPADPVRDRAAFLAITAELAADGTTYVFLPGMADDEVIASWFPPGGSTFLAVNDEGTPLGCYLIKPNQPGRGAHVANGSYVVAEAGRGLNLGRRLGEHSLAEARRRGFRAMQFNLVVATNERAIRLWESLGFRVVGRVPGAFQHATLGEVDALIMHRSLTSD